MFKTSDFMLGENMKPEIGARWLRLVTTSDIS